MATSPNYGWQEPDDTDLVKDGALAIRTMGDDIDSTLATALNSKLHAGLVLVKTQTIGTGVSSVTVTSAFSSDYDNYKIIMSGGVGSTDQSISLKLGSTTTGYYGSLIYATFSAGTVSGAGDNNASAFTYTGQTNTSSMLMNVDITSPQLAKYTNVQTSWIGHTTTSSSGPYNGYLNNTTQYTDFTVVASLGTMTGGTIYVYGYAKD